MTPASRTERELVIEYLAGSCPMQAWGTIAGRPFYFRARWQSWTFSIAATGQDPVGPMSCPPLEYFREQPWGDHPYAAGYMPDDEARAIVRRCAEEYLRTAVGT